MRTPRRPWVVESAALLFPILIVAAPFLFTTRSLHGRDFESFLRTRALYAQEMTARDGEWPRWNGSQYAGTPFLGDLHGSLHYPPNLLVLVMPPERAFGYLFVFHMIVAAIGMYRLSRYFELRRSASVLGALAYGVPYSAAVHMAAGSLDHYVTAAMAPWVLLLILRLVKRVSMLRLVMLAVAVGAVLLGGSPQDFLFLFLLCPGLIYWTSVDAGRRKRPWKKSALIPIAVALALGAALAFASLVPALEVRQAAGSPYPRAEVAGDWRIVYVGVLPSLVAILPFQSFRRGPVLFFAISAIAALVPPLFLPRTPICSLWVVALSIAGLAAVGWDGLARGRYAPRSVARIVAVGGALALVAVGLAYWRFRNAVDAAILLGLVAISAAIVTRLRTHPKAVVAAVLVLGADLCFFDSRTIRTWEPEKDVAPPWYASVIGSERAAYRLYDLTTSDPTPAGFGFRLLNGYGYPRLSCLHIEEKSLEALNVRWLISETAPPNDRWKEIAHHNGRILYETRQPRRAAYLLPPEMDNGPPLRFKHTANSIEVAGRSYQPMSLVVSESWTPGWKAYAQRQQVPVKSGPSALLTVDIPAGDWYITFRYEPDDYRTGRVVSSSAVVALIGLLVAGMRRSKIAIS
jgi:hypothetical protein